MAACGLAGIAHSLSAYHAAGSAAATATAEKKAMDIRLQRLRDDEPRIREAARAFPKLLAAPPDGSGKAPEWIALIDDIQQKYRLLDVRYEHGATQILASSPSESLALVSTPIHMRLKLLHEEDLSRFLDELREQAPALIHIRHCHIGRARTTPLPRPVESRLDANCRIEAVGLQRPHPGGPKP